MSDTAINPGGSPKLDPESLVLRGRPRPVARFKRHVVIGVVGIAAIGIFVATWLALKASPLARPASNEELYNIDRKPTADGLAALPSGYDKIKPALGPPLPGDLGPAELRARNNLGVPVAGAAGEDDAARAEELHLAQLARQANEGNVFFQAGASHAGSVDPTAMAGLGGPAPSADSTPAGDHVALDPTRDPGDVQRKLDFVNAHDDRGVYNPHAIQDPVSPYEVMAGTLISASLITGLDSDLPGLVVAQVTQNVYDTVSGQTLMIPQGSRLIGTYDSVVAFGQSRALVVWQRIIMPDGSSIQIDNLPATDAHGYSGLEDDVDYHTWTLLKGVAISTLLGVSTQLTLNNQSDLVTAIRQSTQDSVNQAGQQLTQKNLNIQPTIKVRPGWPLRVIVHKDLVLRPYRG
jgi:type IV secretory pathway VirB10-like protein